VRLPGGPVLPRFNRELWLALSLTNAHARFVWFIKFGVPLPLWAVRKEVQRRAQSSLPYDAGLKKEDGRTRE